MYKLIGAGLALCLVLGTGRLMAQSETETEATTVTVTHRSTAEEQAPQVGDAATLLAVLNKRVEDDINWEEVSLDYVIEWLRGQGNISVVPRWRPLLDQGVTPDSTVTVQLSRPVVSEVLEDVLSALADNGEVMYRGYGGKLVLSTKADFNRKLFVKVYDVTDILFRTPDFFDAPQIDLQQVAQSAQGGQGGSSGRSIFSNQQGGEEQQQQGEQQEQEAERRLQSLRELIEDTIEPETWDTFGGKASIRVYRNSLVIRAPLEVHEQIAGRFFFESLD